MTARVHVRRDNRVGCITLDDPATFNALDAAMVGQLRAALSACEADCRAIVLTGAGKAFCAGAKLTADALPQGPDHDAGAPLEAIFNPLIAQIAALDVPLVVAINGVAAGGGMGLALSGDIVVASERASLVPAFTRVGLVADCGISGALVRVLGRVRAAEVLMLGGAIDPQRAMQTGLVNRVVPADALLDQAMAIAQQLADGPTIALGLTRKLLWQAGEGDHDAMLARERAAQCTAGRSADHAEAIAAFLARRDPEFSGH